MKELNKTPFITTLLKAAAGEDADLSKLHVYEVRATSTVALRGKRNTIFENAKISPHTISQLAAKVNEDPIPLMMDHSMAGTPFGKFFYGEAVPMDNGEIELRGYMYVDSSEEKILAKLEASTIDEVSIQFLSSHMLCSECGFDYRAAAEEDNYLPLMTHTCDEGHEVGKEGVHVRLVGVDELIELSLVSRGAAKNSKIIGSSDAMLGESAQRLAASGVNVLEDYYCTASINEEGVNDVDLKPIMTKLDALTDEKIDLTTKLSTANAKVATLEGERDSAVTRAETAEAEVTRLTGEAEDAATAAADAIDPEVVTSMSAFVGKQYVALKALDGEADAEVPADIAVAMSFIDENAARLSALIPVDGVSTAAASNDDDQPTEAQKKSQIASLAAFKA